MKVHWGYPDPSNAAGGESGKRAAFEQTREAIAYRMLRMLMLPIETLDDAALARVLEQVARRYGE